MVQRLRLAPTDVPITHTPASHEQEKYYRYADPSAPHTTRGPQTKREATSHVQERNNRQRIGELQGIGSDRKGDVFEVLLAQIGELNPDTLPIVSFLNMTG